MDFRNVVQESMDQIALDLCVYECGGKILGFIKCGEIPDQLRTFYSLRKKSVPWSYSLSKCMKRGIWVVPEYYKCQLGIKKQNSSVYGSFTNKNSSQKQQKFNQYRRNNLKFPRISEKDVIAITEFLEQAIFRVAKKILWFNPLNTELNPICQYYK